MRRLVCFAALVLPLMVFSTGCSIMGYSIGSRIDNGREKRSRPIQDIGMLNEGDSVEIVTADGMRFNGEFESIRTIPYEDAREGLMRLGIPLPETGETCFLVLNSPTRRASGVTFIDLAKEDPALRVQFPRLKEISELPFEKVDSLIDSHGNAITGAALLRLADIGRLPPREIALRVDNGFVHVASDSIASLIWGPSGHARYTGLWIGVAVDVAVVATASVFIFIISHMGNVGLGGTASGSLY